MKRPSVTLAPAAPPGPARSPQPRASRRTPRPPLRPLAALCAAGALLTLGGCYYYPYYGYGYGAAPWYGTGAALSTQQAMADPQAGTSAPAAVPDTQYPAPIYAPPPVTVAAYPMYPVYPAYSAWSAYPGWGWGWGAPAVSFGFGYRSGGGRWRR